MNYRFRYVDNITDMLYMDFFFIWISAFDVVNVVEIPTHPLTPAFMLFHGYSMDTGVKSLKLLTTMVLR